MGEHNINIQFSSLQVLKTMYDIPMKRISFYQTGASVLLVVATIWYAYGIENILQKSTYTDLRVYLRAAKALRDGEPIYDVTGMRSNTFAEYYKYPPFLASLLQFFTSIEERSVFVFFLIVNQVFYFATFTLLCRVFRFRLLSTEFCTLLIGFLLFQPTLDSLMNGQFDCLILFLITVTWWAVVRNQNKWAALPLALATMLKVFPGFTALHLLIRHRWRALGIYGLGLLGLTGISIGLAGWDYHQQYLWSVLPANISSSAYIENQSLLGFFSRFFVDGRLWMEGIPTVVPAAVLLSAAASAIVLFITVRIARQTSLEGTVYAALIVVILLILPVAWIHYETLLILPLAVLFFHQFQNENGWKGWTVFLIGYFLIAYGNQNTVMVRSPIINSYKLFGILLLWFLCVREMKRNSRINSI